MSQKGTKYPFILTSFILLLLSERDSKAWKSGTLPCPSEQKQMRHLHAPIQQTNKQYKKNVTEYKATETSIQNTGQCPRHVMHADVRV